MRKKLLKLSLIMIICAAVIFVINYFFFHFVTDDGITTVWQPEAGKPFVADLIGNLGVLFIFGSAVSALSALVLFEKEK
jgi:hypothetical protein